MTERSCGFDSHRGHRETLGATRSDRSAVGSVIRGSAGGAMRHVFSRLICFGLLYGSFLVAPAAHGALRAGAFAQDITPETFPVIVNGNFTEIIATKANDRLHARSLVLEDGGTTIAIVVVDS